MRDGSLCWFGEDQALAEPEVSECLGRLGEDPIIVLQPFVSTQGLVFLQLGYRLSDIYLQSYDGFNSRSLSTCQSCL